MGGTAPSKAMIVAALTLSLLLSSGLSSGLVGQEAPTAVLSVSVLLDSASYVWYDDIKVTATVTLSGSPALGCDVAATCPLNAKETAVLRDDGAAPDASADDGIYTGYYRLGSANGSAVVAQNNNRITVSASRTGDSGSGDSARFTTYRAERWTGMSTDIPGTYPDNRDTYANLIVTRNGLSWHHRIENLGVVSTLTRNGALIRLPVFPKSNSVSNLTVVNGTEAQAVDNVIQFKANLSNGATARFTVEFDAPSDLAATYIDRYNTGHIGLRQFRNGYIVWNEHVSQAVFGTPCLSPHGQGVNCGMQVCEKESGRMRSVDCMERVALACDGALFNNGDSSYPYNIKWQDQSDNSWMMSADLSQMTFAMTSTEAYCNGDLAVEKTVSFFSGERYIRQNYTVTNADAAPHSAALLWGREQWMYGDTTYLDDNDRGYVGTDPTLYGSGFRIDGSAMTEGFFGALDTGSHYSLAMIFGSEADKPTYMYFLLTPPLTSTGGTYPVDYSAGGADEGSTFFEKQWGTLAPGQTVHSEFYMWGGYGVSAADTQSMVAADAKEIAADATFDIDIHPGWNLISVPLQTSGSAVGDLLSGISGKWDAVKAYNPDDPGDPWKSNRPGGTANDLAELDNTMGFWLHATEACTLSITASEPSLTMVHLRAGWNLVGYPSETNRSASDSLSGTGADVVAVYDMASQSIMRDVTDLSAVFLEPGNGYWVRVPADTVWTVTW